MYTFERTLCDGTVGQHSGLGGHLEQVNGIHSPLHSVSPQVEFPWGRLGEVGRFGLLLGYHGRFGWQVGRVGGVQRREREGRERKRWEVKM